MKVLSLFDGISCGMVALERVGIKVDKYYASEIDKYAIQVTQKNYPNTIQLGDVTKVDGTKLENIDLLIGGSPCQGFSSAGKLLNFNDERSKLFFEYVRILKEIKPKYFLLENVKMKKEHQDIISEHLGVNPIEINSCVLSAQRRSRLYWTNIPIRESINDTGVTLMDILDTAVDESYYINDITFEKITEVKDGKLSVKSLSGKPMFIEHGDGVVLSRTWQTYMPLIKSKSHCIRAMNPNDSGVVVNCNGKLRIRKFTENEIEKLQTLPINYTEGLSSLQRKKVCGNGWTVDVISHIFSGLNLTT
jgi:DNA-cytosine methyltransferase